MNVFLDGGIAAGYMQNGNAESQLKNLGILDRCIPYPTNKAIFEAIEKGELEAGVVRNNVATMLLKELGYNDIKSRFSIGFSYMCFCINADKPELRTALNEAIQKLSSEGTIELLEKKWLADFVKQYSIFETQTWIIPLIVSVFVVLVIFFFTNRKNRKQLRIIETLSKDFDVVILVNVRYEKDSRFSYYKNNGTFSFLDQFIENKHNFSQYIEVFAKYAVFEDDKERFLEKTTKSLILSELSDRGACYVNFRGIIADSVQYYQVKFTSIKDHSGNIINIVVGIHNIDKETKEMMRKNEELLESRKNAETASRAKTEFLFNVSHDLRTPMNAVLGYAENAKHDIDNPNKLTSELDKINIAGKALLDLLNQILEMSRIETGKTELNPANTDLLENLHNLTAIYDVSAQAKNIHIAYDFNNITHQYLFVDSVRFKQIISNILGNAVKYTPEGGNVSLTISEESTIDEDVSNFRITVADNGIGISEEFQSKIFESFTREHNSTTGKVAGFGLGMSIVKKLVDLFGGTITLTSKQNVGTTIIVVLPIKHGKKPIENHSEDSIIDFSSLKILLVDDNEMNREIGVDLLNYYGADVISAEDGDVAVEIIKNSKPGDIDVVLMDVQMPKLNGYEATKIIRELPDPVLANIPIIALTANAFEEDKQNALNAGMDGHVAKPIDIQLLKKVLHSLLGEKLS